VRSETGKIVRCAIYTRKSTEHGLDQEFNSLDAQREACEAYIKSQASQGWRVLPQQYDDPAYSGGNLDRPALKRLLREIELGRVDVIVVYKIDRLTRSLADFAKLVEKFDERSISFVAVTQQFNTTTSMGRLTLNVLFPPALTPPIRLSAQESRAARLGDQKFGNFPEVAPRVRCGNRYGCLPFPNRDAGLVERSRLSELRQNKTLKGV
jgi:Resolvase, N terminal domain